MFKGFELVGRLHQMALTIKEPYMPWCKNFIIKKGWQHLQALSHEILHKISRWENLVFLLTVKYLQLKYSFTSTNNIFSILSSLLPCLGNWIYVHNIRLYVWLNRHQNHQRMWVSASICKVFEGIKKWGKFIV